MRELELPREALVNVIVRDGHAIPPRGSTELQEGDELHILVRSELRDEVEALTDLWAKGPIGRPAPPALPRRGASQVFSVRPARPDDDRGLSEVDGIPVLAVMRSRSDGGGAMLALADGRYAVIGDDLVAIGGRRALAGLVRAAGRSGPDVDAGGARLVAGGHRRADRPRPAATASSGRRRRRRRSSR